MSSLRPGSRKYFQTRASVYIGAGNRMSVITRRSKPAFAKIRQIYGDNMEKMSVVNHELEPGSEVSKELRRRVLKEIRKENRRIVRNRILALIISVIVFGLLVVLGWRIFLWLYSEWR